MIKYKQDNNRAKLDFINTLLTTQFSNYSTEDLLNSMLNGNFKAIVELFDKKFNK